MSAGAYNPLAFTLLQQRMNQQNNENNQIANPQVYNPLSSMTSALQTAAMLKYLKGGGGMPTRTGIAMPGNINYFGNPATGGNAAVPAASATPAQPATMSPADAATSVAQAVLKDSSNPSIHNAFTDLRNSGFGAFSQFDQNKLLAMSPDERRSWAQQQLQPQSSSTSQPPN